MALLCRSSYISTYLTGSDDFDIEIVHCIRVRANGREVTLAKKSNARLSVTEICAVSTYSAKLFLTPVS